MCITKTNSSEKPGGVGEQADNLGKDSWRNRGSGGKPCVLRIDFL